MAQPVDIPPDGGGTESGRVNVIGEVVEEVSHKEETYSSDKKSDEKSDNENIDLVKSDSDSLVVPLSEDEDHHHNDPTTVEKKAAATTTNR